MSLESFFICRQTHKHTQERHPWKIILNYATAVFYMFVFLCMFGWAKMCFMQFYYQSHNRLLYDNVIVCLSANEFFMRHVSTIKKHRFHCSLVPCHLPNMNTHPNIWCFCCFFTISLKLFTMRLVCQDSSNALQLTDCDCCFCRWHTKHCLVSCLMLYFVCFCFNIQIIFFRWAPSDWVSSLSYLHISNSICALSIDVNCVVP